MRTPFLTLAILACCATSGLADDTGSVLVLADTGPEVRIITCPREGEITTTVHVSAAHSIAGSQHSPMLISTGPGRGLLVWRDKAAWVFSRFTVTGRRYRETYVGIWPAKGWILAGATDLDGDETADLVLYQTQGGGDSRAYLYQVAPGTRNGGFALGENRPVKIVTRCRGAYFALGDIDADGHADLVYHSYSWGGAYQTKLYMLRGNGRGGFASVNQARHLLTSPHGATNPILGNFVGGGLLDIFLPPDDDVRDEGQCHIALSRGDGSFDKVKEVFDFRPDNEGSTSDAFIGRVTTADIDGDGQPDLVTMSRDIRARRYSYRVYWGLGDGLFHPKYRTLAEGSYATRPAPKIRAIPLGGKPVENRAEIGEIGPLWLDLHSDNRRKITAAMTRCLSGGQDFLDAVGPIMTDSTRPAPPPGSDEQRRFLRAITVIEQIGGPTATAILEKTIQNAPDEEIRARARTARDRLASMK